MIPNTSSITIPKDEIKMENKLTSCKCLDVESVTRKMEDNSKLKRRFYHYISLKNHEYKIMNEDDCIRYQKLEKGITVRNSIYFLAFSMLGAFFTKFRPLPKPTYPKRLVRSLMYCGVLPLFPTMVIATSKQPEEDELLQIAGKYPIVVRTVYEDFVRDLTQPYRSKELKDI